MFGEAYQFSYRKFTLGDKNHGQLCIKEHLYTFRGKKDSQYMVIVEEYDFDFYAIKFHLKKDRNNKKKYEELTGYNDATRVIRTCVDIMIDLYKKNPYCLRVAIQRMNQFSILNVLGYTDKSWSISSH